MKLKELIRKSGQMRPIGLIRLIRLIGPISPIGPIRPIRPIRPISLIGPIGLIRPILLLPLLFFAACSGGEDVIEPSPQPTDQTAISFSGDLQEERTQTRAGLEEVLTNKRFVVFGYKNDGYDSGTDSYTSYQCVIPSFIVNYGAGTAHSTSSNTDDWEYVGQGDTPEQQAAQTIKYWDLSANAYRFFGYALGNPTASPATMPAAVSIPGSYPSGGNTSATEVTFSTTVDASTDATVAAAPYFSELWFSTGNPTDYPTRQFGQPVELKFVKPFARVRFMFSFMDGLTFGHEALSNIRFRPTNTSALIPTAGTVSVTYPLKGTSTAESWSINSVSGISHFDIDYYETPDPAVTPADTEPTTWPNTPEKWYYVLPTSTQGSYTLEVSIVTTEIKSIVVPAMYMNWKAGYEYTYKFKITETGGITIEIVQVAINDWSNKTSSEHTVYNW